MSFTEISQREKDNAEKSYLAATQGMVLLKNKNGALPIDKTGTIALFGLGAARTVRGGTGSGDAFNGGLGGGGEINVDLSPRYNINILTAFEDAGYTIPTARFLHEYGKKSDAQKASQPINIIGEAFAYPDHELTVEMLTEYADTTDAAIYVISRNAGEGADRHMLRSVKIDGKDVEVGDYMLCKREIENLRLIKAAFKKTIVVLNVGGPVDATPILEVEIDAILLMSQAGQEGGRAVVDVLNGTVNPSGKLTDTWAVKYSDYPASATFGDNDGDITLEKYEEGIYVGYRYFDSFDIEPVFEFGYGLSYTEFDINSGGARLDGDTLKLKVIVKNTGYTSGREVVQVYCSAPESEMDMPTRELVAFRKTDEIPSGGKQEIELSIKIRNLQSFDELGSAYILSAGDYLFSVGASSRDNKPAFALRVLETIVTELVYIEYPLEDKLREIRPENALKVTAPANIFTIELPANVIETIDSRSPYHDGAVTTYATDSAYKALKTYESVTLTEKRDIKLLDVIEGRATIGELVAQLSVPQLASFVCGTGWGVEDENNPIIGGGSESVPGAAGETTHLLRDTFGIPSMIVADGPAGVRVTQEFLATDVRTGEKVTHHHYCTAWPVGTLLAQSFDEAVLQMVGEGIGVELQELGVAIILGPGMNIHRDPLCGRNFEYYSEDPLLTGKMAAAYTRGTQSLPGVGTCLKHYAANNQEANRNAVDTWINQRALREIYLKGFGIAVKESQPMSIMTSYNLVNRIETAHSYDLCTDILRGEWGFKGLIMTDWNGGVSACYKCIHAGNDLVMPGGAVREGDIIIAMEPREPEFDELGQVVMYKPDEMFPTYSARWNSFTPSAGGTDWVTAEIAEGHTAAVVDGHILVDGKPLYTVARGFNEMLVEGDNFRQFDVPATIDNAKLSEDGKSISYRGTMRNEPEICLGELQRCAGNIIRVIMNSVAMKRLYPDYGMTCWK